MATATSRMSLDPPPSLIDLPPLVNPHPLPNPHARVPELAPAAYSQTRRVSSESQGPGRASPSPRITRRTPVPFLLEAFPAPPSHIPRTPTCVSPSNLLNSPSLLASATSWMSSAAGTSAVSTNSACPSSSNATSPCSPKAVAATLLPHSNPPPSSPPTGPLPPIPGPSSGTPDLFTTQRAIQVAPRSTSPALARTESQRSQSSSESRPRSSLESNESVRGRRRQGSLSSLRNPVYPMGEQNKTIAEEPVEEHHPSPLPPSAAPLYGSRKNYDQSRDKSHDSHRPSLPRMAVAPLRPDDEPYAEDSIASVDMSDLNAIKSDNDGEGDEQASRPFPQFPPLPHSQPQSPIDRPPSGPLCVHTPRKPSKSSVYSVHVSCTLENVDTRQRAMSPEITQIISATPCLRKHSTPSRSRDSSSTRNRKESSRGGRAANVPPVPTSSQGVKTPLVTSGGDEVNCSAREDEANESDSSLDLHTPLPQLMLRHGMLSPNSKLLPQPEADPTRLSVMSGLSWSSYVSNASNVSLMSTTSTSSKHPKDARDTPQRRVRHRDGKLLKGGIGLTTGLGWSDSEDEDAPSLLTRRVSSLVLSRRTSSPSIQSQSQSRSLPRSLSHNILREVDEQHEPDEFGNSHRSSLASRSLPSRSKPVSRVGSTRSTGSSLGRYSAYSISSVPSTGIRARGSSVSESSIYTASDSLAYTDGNSTGLMPGIREHDDGITPTRAAFERSSVDSTNGGSSADIPHTPSSTASSGSLPFPLTPESGEEIPQLQPAYNHDKVLPPLPLSARGKYSTTLSLQSQSAGLHRTRTCSNASSVSNSSMLGALPADAKSRSASSTSTPRQSLAERHTKIAIPAASSRPSLNGTPRPSLTIPKTPLSPQSPISGLPRSTTPSLSTYTNAGQGYTPRPLKLAELNQSPTKVLQPGEQPPRPGQILTYNRNVHDELKLRTLSLNTGPNRAQVPVVSPGGTQTVFMSSPGPGSAASPVLSTPVTARSQSPLLSPGGEGIRPRPRTGTGMMYRTNLSVGTAVASRIRVPSTVPR